MSDAPYTLIQELSGLIETIPTDSIVSRTFVREGDVKGIVFGFAAGQELTEHTSTQTAIIHIVSGEADVTLGEDSHKLHAGSWALMPPNLKHSVYAKTPVIMVLTMFNTRGRAS
ncbi:MAG: cupin domain-containing protein [Chloroflexi bacterium]|jgi:quercetin dioxygenase-like cupin family protein|nr:MAG: cupin [Chloroflexi bacterium OLB13]MBC6957745.1 cupin domain-containing protein [Chloroflexota bacterium]MBV6438049.1 hypothetical protein [Anaerolineae bacterium]MDL1917450.1 cupin domain-containing protein [Anaerolineae bacterium CFX4]OQY83760.1 MAG: hypothetical protein B6D42_06910 [Anaerolineae bacterium UTCFX5]